MKLTTQFLFTSLIEVRAYKLTISVCSFYFLCFYINLHLPIAEHLYCNTSNFKTNKSNFDYVPRRVAFALDLSNHNDQNADRAANYPPQSLVITTRTIYRFSGDQGLLKNELCACWLLFFLLSVILWELLIFSGLRMC